MTNQNNNVKTNIKTNTLDKFKKIINDKSYTFNIFNLITKCNKNMLNTNVVSNIKNITNKIIRKFYFKKA